MIRIHDPDCEPLGCTIECLFRTWGLIVKIPRKEAP
jgi:hypothetical protein